MERRENLLEDHSALNRAKTGHITGQQLFDYYLGWLTDSSITAHFQFIPDAQVAYARRWGMRVEIEDLRRVVKAAKRVGGHVVVGGHSLGGSITTAYATWNFGGKPGARGLSGLVFIDGGSSPTPISRGAAEQALKDFGDGAVALAHLRRHPGAVHRSVQLHRSVGRDHRTRTRRRSARPGRCFPRT